MKYIGLDAHKDIVVASVISDKGKNVKTMSVEASPEGLEKIHQYLGSTEYCVILESSTYAYLPYRFFDDLGVETHIIHAQSFKVITDTDRKTDLLDSDKLGKYLRLWKRKEIELSMSFVPSREQCELKDICRRREELSKKLGDEARRIKCHLVRNLMNVPDEFLNLHTKKSRNYLREKFGNDQTLMSRLREYEFLISESESIASDIESRMPDDINVELLAEIPGIGRQTAVQLMSMIVDINRFESSEKISAYFGMVPRVRDSGGKENHGRMTKKGDSMMRSILERCVLSHMRFCDSSVKDFYNRKKSEIGTKKALVASARKLLTIIFTILKQKRSFMLYSPAHLSDKLSAADAAV